MMTPPRSSSSRFLLDTGLWQLVVPLHEAGGLDVLWPVRGKLTLVYSNAAAPASATV